MDHLPLQLSSYPKVQRPQCAGEHVHRGPTPESARGDRRLHLGHGLGMYDPLGTVSLGQRIVDSASGTRYVWTPCFFMAAAHQRGQNGGGAARSRRRVGSSDSSQTIRMHPFQYIASSTTALHHVGSTRASGSARRRQLDVFSRSPACPVFSGLLNDLLSCRALSSDCHDTTGLNVYVTSDSSDVYEDRFRQIASNGSDGIQPTLILLGIRLGIDRVTPVYRPSLAAALKMPQSVGIAGSVSSLCIQED